MKVAAALLCFAAVALAVELQDSVTVFDLDGTDDQNGFSCPEGVTITFLGPISCRRLIGMLCQD